MSNNEVAEKLESAISLLELTEANPFKINAFRKVSSEVERLSAPIQQMSVEELNQHFSKSMAQTIVQILETGSFEELNQLESEVPIGVRSMLKISGLGPKKVKAIWKESGILSLEALEKAAQNGQISLLKGFGPKIQEAIISGLQFLAETEGKLLMHDGQNLGNQLQNSLEQAGFTKPTIVGDLASHEEIVHSISFLMDKADRKKLKQWLEQQVDLEWDKPKSGPFHLATKHLATSAKINFHFSPDGNMAKSALMLTSSSAFWHNAKSKQIPAYQNWVKAKYHSEKEYFQQLGHPFIAPELRTGSFEWEEDLEKKLKTMVSWESLKGCLHNHSLYSDGKNTLEEMAQYCRDKGWRYFGIADHSQSAQYAGGLSEERVWQQWAEIDALNNQWTDFRIFKGIESDILSDGKLDYPDELLTGFDYVVASVHSGMKMDINTATNRLITAIEHPSTSILGHCSTRILLKRSGFHLHYDKIIDACLQNKVAIELNAHPSRLDMAWPQIAKALEKGCIISINPDAHEKQGMDMMQFGVWMARKAGADTAQVLNTWETEEVARFFKKN